ncbi:MAG TPA: hypothetical protein VHY20_02615, partial [Pirellulales bacterium]|nr:hypothetical protein [Pirellulales bacterium]
ALDSPHRTWLLIERDFDDLSLIGTKSNPGTKLLLDHIASRMHRVAANDRADLYELIPAPQTAAPAMSRMTSSLQPAAR